MAEKMSKPPPNVGLKPVPMKLFATWEVDRTAPNCIARLCSLTLSHLVVLKPLGQDLGAILIAVKMQSSKRTLRSNEMLLPPNGLLDTDLELNFSLQYPHFLKRDGNKLHIMLQRRKRYKNRAILGYKTLAEGVINMSQVLQRQMDLELDLFSDSKEKNLIGSTVARVSVLALDSQPVDREDTAKHLAMSEAADRVADFSDEEDDFSSNEDGEGELSDSEPTADDGRTRRTRKAGVRTKMPANARQRNLKQKFIALLKRFRVTEDLQGLDNDQEVIGQKLSGGEMDPTEIEDLFEELEDMSDSGPEMDTMSISSTPKPSLRPFFSSSRSLLQESLNVPGGPVSYARNRLPLPVRQPHIRTPQIAEKSQDRLSDESSKKADSDSHPENWTDPEQSDPQQGASSPPKSAEDRGKESGDRDRRSRLFNRDRNSSASKSKKQTEKSFSLDQKTIINNPSPIQDGSLNEPRKVLLEQLSRVLPPDDASLPGHLLVVNAADPQGSLLATRLHERQQKVVSTMGPADVRATVTCLVTKIQKFCNSNAKPPPAIKVLLAGSDSFVNSVLRHYVEQLSFKPLDWQNYIKFLLVPLGYSSLSRYLGSVDGVYAAAFTADSWKELLERAELQKTDCQEMLNRVHRYLQNATAVMQLPIAEAMITYKEKRLMFFSKPYPSSLQCPRFGNRLGLPRSLLCTLSESHIHSTDCFKFHTNSSFPYSMDCHWPNTESSDDESSQIFIPFLTDVRLGSPESQSISMDLEESQVNTGVGLLSGSPPSLISLPEKKERITPPSSPNINSAYTGPLRDQSLLEPLELQLDYWLIPGKASESPLVSKSGKGDTTKSTLKSTFRSLYIQRLPPTGEPPSLHFLMSYSSKEKKQKIMRLGKKKEKEKESEPKCQTVEGVSRLICSAKTHGIPLKVCIDGTEWSGIKFFQLSAQWQTHIKHLPILLFACPESVQ